MNGFVDWLAEITVDLFELAVSVVAIGLFVACVVCVIRILL